MPNGSELRLDAATGIGQGRREHQEDAIIADFPIGGEIGLAVLADGMGGHAAGDIASRIAVTEVFSELKLNASDPDAFVRFAPDLLRDAASEANSCIAGHIRAHSETRGMGTTLVALAVANNRLFWVSIGDSPLFLYRDGQLRRINEDHSLAPQIDGMVRMGLLSVEEARTHPDRNCLTSAITGAEISRIDCPDQPLDLAVGDILIAASDGLTFIDPERIRTILAQYRRRSSAEIANALFHELEEIGDPEQDNVCFSVIRVVSQKWQPAPVTATPVRIAPERSRDRAEPAAARRPAPRGWWIIPPTARFLFNLGKRAQ